MVNGTLLNIGKRNNNNVRVIFDQWLKLHLGLDALTNQKILKGIYRINIGFSVQYSHLLINEWSLLLFFHIFPLLKQIPSSSFINILPNFPLHVDFIADFTSFATCSYYFPPPLSMILQLLQPLLILIREMRVTC